MDTMLREGYKRSLKITREHAKTFYFCSMFLNKDKRLAAYSVYAFSRMVDDTFDRDARGGEIDLKTWHDTINSIYSATRPEGPVFMALAETVKKYGIPEEYFHELVNGMEMDLTKKEYKDFPELYLYCYRVAGVIGLIMLKIFGYSGEKAPEYAEKMGVAMQLTNILRDIKEDLEMGRLYIPLKELEAHGVKKEYLKEGAINDNFKNFMKFQIARARSYYHDASLGIKLINDTNSRFIARLMGTLYSAILDSIEKNGYDVFSKRVFVPFGEKVRLLCKTLLKKDVPRG